MKKFSVLLTVMMSLLFIGTAEARDTDVLLERQILIMWDNTTEGFLEGFRESVRGPGVTKREEEKAVRIAEDWWNENGRAILREGFQVAFSNERLGDILQGDSRMSQEEYGRLIQAFQQAAAIRIGPLLDRIILEVL